MPVEILALALLVPVAVGIFWMEQTRKTRMLATRIASLRPKNRSDSLLMRIPWKELSGVETQMALVGVALSLVVAFMFSLPAWLMLVELAVVCPVAWVLVRRFRVQRFRARFSERFPDAVDGLTRAVQAGVPVMRALESLGEIFEGVMADRFKRLVQQLELGVPFRDALRNFSGSLNLPDVDYFCSVLALNRESGSPLSPMLITLSQTLRERQAVERKLQSLTAEARASARVLSFLPLFILGLQAFLNPAQMQFLVQDPTGRIILGYCAVSMIVGLLVIRRMSRMVEA